MWVYLCPQGHKAKQDNDEGWAHCDTCNQAYSRGQLRSTITETERLQELADAEMVLAALEADRTLESQLAGLSYEQQIEYVRTHTQANPR